MRTFYFPVLITAVLLLQSCRSDRSEPAQKNALLPDRLVVFSESVFGLPGDARPENLAGIEKYNESVIRKALSGDLALHEVILSHHGLPGTETMSVENLCEILEINLKDPQENLDSTINACVREITSGLFVEEWILDEDPFRLRKKVIAYQPVLHEPLFYDDPLTFSSQPTGDTTRILLFSVLTDPPEEPASVKNGKEGQKLLAENIRYEIDLFNRPYYEFLYTDENEVSETAVEQWANYNFNFYKYFDRELFIDKILDEVTSGDVKAFDPFDQKKILNLKEIYTKLMVDSIFEPIRDTLTGEIRMDLTEVHIPREDINSLIFIEDWYYNEASMGIIKIVRGVIPILHMTSYDINSSPAGTLKIPVFLVWFNKD